MEDSTYTVYNMRSRFETMPGQPERCPLCGGKLSGAPVGPSRQVLDDLEVDSLIPVHNFSLLFVCEACRWWCIRESWDYCEIGSELDYLIAGTAANDSQPGAEPWLEILADPELYRHEKELPANLAAIFPPHE